MQHLFRFLFALHLAAALGAGSLFDSDGIFTPAQTRETTDLQASRVSPGDEAGVPGVLRLDPRGHHRAWRAATSEAPTTFHYLLAYTAEQPVGTCIFVGNFELSYLKAGAPLDPHDEANWEPVAYPGPPGRQLRVVPLPPGVSTRALRLSGLGVLTAAGHYASELALFTALRERLVNIAPAAELTVSSSDRGQSGFRPDPRRSSPEVLLDGSLQAQNWYSVKRKEPISTESPEWLLLDWREAQTMRGLALFIGTHQPGAGEILVQRFTGTGEPAEADETAWETVGTIRPERPWRPPLAWEATLDFGQELTTRAIRLLVTSGLTKEQAAGGERATLDQIGFGEIVIVKALGEQDAPPRIARPRGLPEGVVPITFTMPHAGKASIRIVDADGQVVTNLVNGEAFEAGEQTVWWDLTTIDDYWPPFVAPARNTYRVPDETRRIALPGDYRWEGIRHAGLSLDYLYSYYPLKEHGLAWITADRTGGWLADHRPPQTIVRVGDRIWVGTFCEAGHALLEADLQMRKLWGSGRIWLACPRVMAVAGDKLYYVEQGGWAKKVVMIELDPQTKQSRRLFGRDIDPDEKLDIQGLAVVGTRAFIADRANDRISVVDMRDNLAAKAAGFSWDAAWKLFDHEQMQVVQELAIPKPGRLRPYDDRHIAVVSDTTVQLLDVETLTLRPLITGLTNPLGLAVDDQGRLYVGEMAPLHQVKVFTPDGQLVRTIGREGPHRLGPYDRDNLESPAGIEVDAAGNVWVCELNDDLKRTSVWDPAGNCLHEVLGPTVYGGGGDLDPRDPDRSWYHGKEFRRDPQSGEIRLERIVWRQTTDDYDRFFGGAAHNFGGQVPAYPFYHNDQLYFTSWQGWAAGSNTTIWRYAPEGMRPIAALGTPPAWLGERFPELAGAAVFAWTDRNGDGRTQREEVEAGPITLNGQPWDQVGARWQFRMNDAFVAAVSDAKYGHAAIAWFTPASFTDDGYPVYILPTELTPIPLPGLGHSADAVYTDRAGNAISTDEFLLSMAPDGTINWRYHNRWPGLHKGHHTTATGEEPGVLIAPTRFFGGAWVNDAVGEVFSLNSNLGATHLFTADGFYIDRVFQDIRTGLAWQMNAPPSPEIMNRISLDDEHFGGTFQKVVGPNGQPHYRYVVGKTHASVVELHGLDSIERLPGGDLVVSVDHLSGAESLHRQRALQQSERKSYSIPRLTNITVDGVADDWPPERINGFAIAYDDTHLYLWYQGSDNRAPFRNATTDDYLEAFKNGDVVDLMLQTRPDLDPRRQSAGEGDIRLSFAEVNGEPAAILYDYVVPGTPEDRRLPFSSPWRTIYIDRVTLIPEATIVVKRQAASYSLEASVPLAALGLDPPALPVTRGDVGVVHSDQTGTRAVAREYWSNKATNIMSDVPSEAMLQPHLWGEFHFAPE